VESAAAARKLADAAAKAAREDLLEAGQRALFARERSVRAESSAAFAAFDVEAEVDARVPVAMAEEQAEESPQSHPFQKSSGWGIPRLPAWLDQGGLLWALVSRVGC